MCRPVIFIVTYHTPATCWLLPVHTVFLPASHQLRWDLEQAFVLFRTQRQGSGSAQLIFNELAIQGKLAVLHSKGFECCR